MRIGLACLAVLPASCSGGEAEPVAPGVARQPVVYGADDRREPFEVDAVLRSLALERAVALVRKSTMVESAPSLIEAEGVCDDERFANQPSAAACSGLLVERDLVLTAGHCARRLPCDDLRLVTGYAYRDATSTSPFDGARMFDCAELLHVEWDAATSPERLDYAWLRLSEPAAAAFEPLALPESEQPLAPGEGLVTFGFPSGLPLKIDAGGTIADPRSEARDYFVATTDSFHAGSGAPVFDAELRLIGIQARGAPDYLLSEGCRRVSVQPDEPRFAEEQATHAMRAVEGLCAAQPALHLCCTRAGNCAPAESSDSGCALVSSRVPVPGASGFAMLAAAALFALLRRCQSNLPWRLQGSTMVSFCLGRGLQRASCCVTRSSSSRALRAV